MLTCGNRRAGVNFLYALTTARSTRDLAVANAAAAALGAAATDADVARAAIDEELTLLPAKLTVLVGRLADLKAARSTLEGGRHQLVTDADDKQDAAETLQAELACSCARLY